MAYAMKNAPVTSKKKVVGQATFPVFDEKDVATGLNDIMGFDWISQGYKGPEHAIVSLVNTQHATNVKNAIRAKANPTLTNEKLQNLAMQRFAELPIEEMKRVATTIGMEAWINQQKETIKAEHEAKVKEILDAAPDAGENDEEEVNQG